jgi:hypothetical protein
MNTVSSAYTCLHQNRLALVALLRGDRSVSL